MNTKIHILILFLISLSLDASNQNFSHTISTEERNKTRDNLFLYNQGCILTIKQFLSPTFHIEIENENMPNDIVALQNLKKENRRIALLKNALIPQIARLLDTSDDPCFIQNYRNQTGMSLLSIACAKHPLYPFSDKMQDKYNIQKINFLKYLIANKVDVNSQDTNGDTAIHHAIQYPCTATFQQIEMLVKKGHANINIQNNKGETPLLAATSRMVHEENKHNRYIRSWLKNLGTDINIKNNDGKTEMDILKLKGTGLM